LKWSAVLTKDKNPSEERERAPYLAHWQLFGLLVLVGGSVGLLVLAVAGVTP
jgi:hypothetical protein